MNPAALAALANNNLDDAITAIIPGGIEVQEAQGNQAFVANGTLPKCSGKDKEYLEQMGVVFGDDADDIFVNVQLPDGWAKQPGEDSRGSYLVDNHLNKRASIFYKAAFYDRYASISLLRRFYVTYKPVDGRGSEKTSTWIGVIMDRGIVGEGEILRTAPIEPEPPYPNRGDEPARQRWLTWNDQRENLTKKAAAWLDETYPDWHSPVAYWD